MKRGAREAGFAAVVSAALLCDCRTVETFGPPRRAALAESIVGKWPVDSRLTAEKLIARYGPPDALASGALAWRDKAPWKRIVVWDANAEYVFEHGTTDNLRETAACAVPDGALTAEEARGLYARTVALAAAGKSMESMRRLTFVSAP